MNSDRFKQLYALLLFLSLIGWAVFTVWITYRAAMDKLTQDILIAAGANTLLGALTAWNADIKQHYFRKRVKEE